MRNFIGFFAVIFLLASCNMNYEKSPSGIIYKVYEADKKGEKLKVGTNFKYHLVYDMPEKDTFLFNTEGHIPSYAIIDSTQLGKYNFLDLLVGRSVGDKIEFVYSIDTLFKQNPGNNYNNVFGRRDVVHGRVTILQTFNSPEEMQKDLRKEEQMESEREKQEVRLFIAKKKIKTVETPLGVSVEVESKGSGALVDTGTIALVYYTGKLLNGKVFDTNKNPSGHSQPMAVPIGKGSTIPGFEEGLKQFAKGGKGKIYLPSFLGYGQRGSAPVIPPYAHLIFEVEIVDVQTQPASIAPNVNDEYNGH